MGLDVVPDPVRHRGLSETIALMICVLMVGGAYLARQIFLDRLEAQRDQHVSTAQFHSLAAAAYAAILVTDTDGHVM
jgi:PAS domain-containing protein